MFQANCKWYKCTLYRSNQSGQTYVLPVTEDKAGDYTCEVTIGTAVSSYSAVVTVTATGFYILFLYYNFLDTYKRL